MNCRQGWMALALLTALTTWCQADIFRWDNGQLIPGTEGVTPGPGAQFNGRNLEYADLSRWERRVDLSGSQFNSSNLSTAVIMFAKLADADFAGANLTGADLGMAELKDADLSGAVVARANFGSTTQLGFTKDQLYSTASYQAKDLRGIQLGNLVIGWQGGPPNDLTGWDFRNQNLSDATFRAATLTNADFAGAVVTGADFQGATRSGFTQDQLYSTASYQARDLRRVALWSNDLTGWNLSGQNLANSRLEHSTLTNANLARANLTGADLYASTLTNTDFTGAIVAGADFAYTAISKEQLYSTASYQAKDLREIRLSGCCPSPGNDLSGWDFTGQNLSGAVFHGATLTDFKFTGANLTNTTFIVAQLTNADLTATDMRGAQGLSFADVVSRNAIFPLGRVRGLELFEGETLLIRDDDGVAASSPGTTESARPPISVTVEDRFTMENGSVLRLLVDADIWNSTISFTPGSSVELAGALELAFADGVDVAAQVGRTLRVFDWTGVAPTGRFEIQSPYVWDVSNLYTSGEVTLQATSALSGDFNRDGTVDAADYVIWRKIDGAQNAHDMWRANFGRALSIGVESGAIVPEPGTAILFVLAIAMVRWRTSPA